MNETYTVNGVTIEVTDEWVYFDYAGKTMLSFTHEAWQQVVASTRAVWELPPRLVYRENLLENGYATTPNPKPAGAE